MGNTEENYFLFLNMEKNKVLFLIKISLIIILFLIFIINSLSINNIILEYDHKQKDFCSHIEKYYNQEIESKIVLADIKIGKLYYSMYVPNITHNKRKHGIIQNHSFELKESINILNALKYYKKIKKIKSNKNIYMIDIGGNIGWYPSFLGRYGYSILSFEPFEDNYYISRKNYCHLNKNSNVIIINKGLYNKEQICDFYKDTFGYANGMILCNNNKKKVFGKRFKKVGIVSLMKFSTFIPYLSNKNIAVMKIDVEGTEGKVIESGIDLITKLHVPFIFLEFTPKFLRKHKTDPYKFIQLFIKNGYKIILNGFLNKNYISYNELKKIKFQINCYFIYTKINEII